MNRKFLLAAYAGAFALHCACAGAGIARGVRDDFWRRCLMYYAASPASRYFINSADDILAIKAVKDGIPEDGRILWMRDVSPIVAYHIFPRRIYPLPRGAAADPDFLRTRRITHIFAGPGNILEVRYAHSGGRDGT